MQTCEYCGWKANSVCGSTKDGRVHYSKVDCAEVLKLQNDDMKRVLEHIVECKSPTTDCMKGWAQAALDRAGTFGLVAEKPIREGDGHICIAAEEVPCSLCGRVTEKQVEEPPQRRELGDDVSDDAMRG